MNEEPNNLISISDLKCSYNGEDNVLEVKALNIVQGKLCVILGVSGSGKSTLLETVGLMNNTIQMGSKITLNINSSSLDYYSIWNNGNDNQIADIRQKYFSFIFQDTNLMPNFSAYENIGITQMIDGISSEKAITNAKVLAESLNLHINEQKKSFELSGGEKQRAAFVRAISCNYDILFGDEPTGNLDEDNSRILLKILRQQIETDNRTAIIVSHNIDLAIEFADQIIIIGKTMTSEDKGYGFIPSDNVLTAELKGGKKIWYNTNGEEIKNNIREVVNNALVITKMY